MFSNRAKIYKKWTMQIQVTLESLDKLSRYDIIPLEVRPERGPLPR